jgi:oligopeptide/dipeptide ABC transporter ATP-binding protein
MYRGVIVESAPAVALFDTPHHPYTMKLLASAPDIVGDEWTPQPEIELQDLPESVACVYAEQCQERVEECTHAPPQMVTVGENHQVRCWGDGR